MSKIDDDDAVQNVARTAQIIVGAMAGGVLLFWVIVTVVLPNLGGPRPPAVAVPGGPQRLLGLPMLTAAAWLFGAGSLAASLFVPRAVVDSALKPIAKGVSVDETKLEDSGLRQIYPASDVGKLLPAYMTQLIIASALIEGGAFFAAIAYMLEKHPPSLLLGGALIALLLSRFPTPDRIRAWLDVQLDRLEVLRRDDF